MLELTAFHQRFVTEGTCVDYLAEVRWRGNPTCPSCGRGAYACRARYLFKCTGCSRQFTVRTGTIFENSRLPLRKWFLAIYFTTQYRRGISSIQLAQRLDITQKSAWHMLKAVRSELVEASDLQSHAQRLPLVRTDLSFEDIVRKLVDLSI